MKNLFEFLKTHTSAITILGGIIAFSFAAGMQWHKLNDNFIDMRRQKTIDSLQHIVKGMP